MLHTGTGGSSIYGREERVTFEDESFKLKVRIAPSPPITACWLARTLHERLAHQRKSQTSDITPSLSSLISPLCAMGL